MDKNVQVWYLFHSGFAVKHRDCIFIFDYYNNISSNKTFDLNHGVINPKDLKDYHVFVFVSHSHYDHYNSVIFTWANDIPNIHYIVSPDVKLNRNLRNIHVMKPHDQLQVEGIFIETLDSNDLGVAYIVQQNDLTIFHSGDLSWWYGMDEAINQADERIFKQEYELLKEKSIDLAFIPVSPKLKSRYAYALDYYMKHIAKRECHIFPMHFGLNVGIFSWLERDGYLNDGRVKQFYHRGLIDLDQQLLKPNTP